VRKRSAKGTKCHIVDYFLLSCTSAADLLSVKVASKVTISKYNQNTQNYLLLVNKIWIQDMSVVN